MYYVLNSPTKDKYTDMGMVNISASFFLEEGDEGWDKYQKEHHVIVPVFPPEGYQGKVDEFGNPVDQKDYDAWKAALPTIERDNPFCNHAIQFDANELVDDVNSTKEEKIMWCFEYALAQTAHNYICDDLSCQKGTTAKVVNQDIMYIARKAFYQGIKTIPPSIQTAYEKAELVKCVDAETKVTALRAVDFTNVETIASYSVRK